jgi:hypothetical protein
VRQNASRARAKEPFRGQLGGASLAQTRGDDLRRTRLHKTVIYEAHVRGLTKRHPDVPEALRGTYAPWPIGELWRDQTVLVPPGRFRDAFTLREVESSGRLRLAPPLREVPRGAARRRGRTALSHSPAGGLGVESREGGRRWA